MTEKPKETPKEELECPKKYVYDTGIIFECKDNIKVEIIGEDVVDLLNEQDKEIKEISDTLDNMVDFKNKYRDKYKQLKKENEQLREALKNSYVTELCENCKYVIYESWEVPFCGWEHDRDCKKGHNECEVTECDDFELNLKVWLND